MTPQQRHMDQARKILSMLVPFSEWCPPWEKAVNELALALVVHVRRQRRSHAMTKATAGERFAAKIRAKYGKGRR